MNRWLALVCLILAPDLIQAQTPAASPSGGLWMEVSASAGAARLTCRICDTSREVGPALGFSVGAYASPVLRVGLDATAWTHEEGDLRESFYAGGLVAQLHPVRGRGLHLIGGLGWSGYRADEFSYDSVRLTLGAGWDLPLVSGWVVGNRLTLDASSFAALKSESGTVARPVGLSVLRFGVYVRRP